MELPVVQDQDVQAIGESVCKAVQEVLESIAVETGPFEQEPLSGLRFDRSVEVVALVGRPLLLNRLYAGERDSTSDSWHQSKPTLVLAEQPNGPLGLGSNRLDPGWKLFFERYLLLLAFFG
jgi:hypothetical protein